MATSPALSAPELELKRRGRRRLIGAVALGLIAIVVLPMVFDSEPKRANKTGQEISVQIPPRDGVPPLPAPVPPPAARAIPGKTTADTPVKIAPPPVSVVLPDTPPPTAAPPAVAVTPTASKAAPVPVVPPAVAAAKIKSGFVVQVGAFRDADNVKQLVEQMKAAGLPVFTDAIAVVGGNVTRVRVGPFADRAGADAARARVKLAGADGKVVPFP